MDWVLAWYGSCGFGSDERATWNIGGRASRGVHPRRRKGKGWTGCPFLFLFQVKPGRKPHWAETKGRRVGWGELAQRRRGGMGVGGRIRWSCFQLPPWSVIRGIHHNRMDQGMDSTHLCGQVANATAPSAGGFRFRMGVSGSV